MAIGRKISLTPNVKSKKINVTATADQTLFTVTGGYRINNISVYRNGALLAVGSDFIANDGATVTLLSAATAGDVVQFEIFDTHEIAGALNQNGDQVLNGALTVTGIVSASSIQLNELNVTGVATAISVEVGNNIKIGNAGVITATSFTGDGANLTNVGVDTATVDTGSLKVTGISTLSNVVSGVTTAGGVILKDGNIVAVGATLSGVLTYEDVTNVDSVGVVTARVGLKVLAGGINAVGVITGTSFKGDGSSLTGIAATDTIAAASLTVSGISTLSNTKIGIGKSINFGSVQKTSIQGHSIGIGTTTVDGVAAGLGTAVGEIVYVMDDTVYGEQLRVYNGYQWVGITTEAVITSMQATGGNATVTENGYRRHIFTSPGNLVVSKLASPASVLVVAGGGAGGGSTGNGQAGGGGAGGFRLASAIAFANGATYPVTVGSGGAGSAPPGPGQGGDGANSVFGYPTAITATGGGGGGGFGSDYVDGRNGGSGGGDGTGPTSAGSGNAGGNDPRCSPISEGSDGGDSSHNSYGCGGGGAAQAGQGDGDNAGPGGIGAPVPANIAPTSYGESGPSPGRYFAGGGGGGGSNTPSPATGGTGGGAIGGKDTGGGEATINMGGGGGGAQGPGSNQYAGGNGGPGIVIVSYPYLG